MSWTEKAARRFPQPSSKKQLRWFGLLSGAVFCLVGLWPMLAHGLDTRAWAVAAGGILVVLGLLWPEGLGYPYSVWMLIGSGLGWVNTKIVLTLFFYLVFTPIALLMRFIKRNPMRSGFEPALDTYRVTKNARSASDLKRQF